MPESIYPVEFEDLLQAALAVPEPDPAFMDSLRGQFLSRPNLLEKETKVKPRFLRFSPRLAWGLALLALLALIVAAFSSPDVVNAMRRLLGYIPGVGVVEQGSSLRVLAQPVTQSREGITLTVEQAAATSDKTVIVYKYVLDSSFAERTPAAQDGGSTPGADQPTLRLPDGSRLGIISGLRQASDPQDVPGSSVRYRMEFGPLPQGLDHVVLLLPRLIPLQPGRGPENWEIALDFKRSTGTEEMPVIEVLATHAPIATPTRAGTAAAPDHGVSFVLDKVIPLQDGYIFMGYTHWILESTGPSWSYSMDPNSVVMRDASGQDIPFDYATPEQIDRPGWRSWAFQVQGKSFQWPITITAGAMWGDITVTQSQDTPAFFEFDPGPDPHAGQTWPLDEDFKIAGYTTHISSARMLDIPDYESYLYEFTMDSPDGVVAASLLDLDRPLQTGQGGGGGGLPEPGPFVAPLSYSGKPPVPGPLRVGVFGISLVLRHSWQVSWSPDGGTVGGGQPVPSETAPAQVIDTFVVPPDAAAVTEHGISLALEKVTHLQDSYRFEGSIRWTDPLFDRQNGVSWQDGSLVDANGQAYPQVIQYGSIYRSYEPAQPGQTAWSYEIKGTDIHWPVTIRFDNMLARVSPQASFRFDPGPDPQLHQTWALDQSMQVGAYTIHVSSARLLGDPSDKYLYRFTLESSPPELAMACPVEQHAMTICNAQMESPGQILTSLFYDPMDNGGKPYSAAMRVSLSEIDLLLHGPWQITWSPPGQ